MFSTRNGYGVHHSLCMEEKVQGIVLFNTVSGFLFF